MYDLYYSSVILYVVMQFERCLQAYSPFTRGSIHEAVYTVIKTCALHSLQVCFQVALSVLHVRFVYHGSRGSLKVLEFDFLKRHDRTSDFSESVRPESEW